MNKMKWIIFGVVVVALFGGIIWLNKSNEKPFTGDASKIITEGPIADYIYGSHDQKVTLIEYGDYQCPACGVMYQPTKDITTAYKDKLTFIFREFPLTSLHPNALAAATAAEAAGLQGRYWEMHDLIYESQDSWKDAQIDQRSAIFEGYASQLGLDANKFKQDLGSKDIAAKISRDRSSANQYSISGTPTYVLNGKKLDTSVSTNADALRKAVEDALKAAYTDFQPVPVATPQTPTQ